MTVPSWFLATHLFPPCFPFLFWCLLSPWHLACWCWCPTKATIERPWVFYSKILVTLPKCLKNIRYLTSIIFWFNNISCYELVAEDIRYVLWTQYLFTVNIDRDMDKNSMVKGLHVTKVEKIEFKGEGQTMLKKIDEKITDKAGIMII